MEAGENKLNFKACLDSKSVQIDQKLKRSTGLYIFSFSFLCLCKIAAIHNKWRKSLGCRPCHEGLPSKAALGGLLHHRPVYDSMQQRTACQSVGQRFKLPCPKNHYVLVSLSKTFNPTSSPIAEAIRAVLDGKVCRIVRCKLQLCTTLRHSMSRFKFFKSKKLLS